MGSFHYGTPEKRQWRKNVAIRYTSIEQDTLDIVNKILGPEEYVQYVIVKEIHPDNKVLLEFCCSQGVHGVKRIDGRIFHKQTIFHIMVRENPYWCCYSDFGRGCVETKKQHAKDN